MNEERNTQGLGLPGGGSRCPAMRPLTGVKESGHLCAAIGASPQARVIAVVDVNIYEHGPGFTPSDTTPLSRDGTPPPVARADISQ